MDGSWCKISSAISIMSPFSSSQSERCSCAHCTEVSQCPRLRARNGRGQGQLQWGRAPPHHAGPWKGGLTPLESRVVKCSQRKRSLVGKLRSAGVRHKDFKCFQHKSWLRDTQIGDADMRAAGTKAQRRRAHTRRANSASQTSRWDAPGTWREARKPPALLLPINKMTK